MTNLRGRYLGCMINVCMFKFIRNCQTLFWNYNTVLHVYQQPARALVALHPRQHLMLSGFGVGNIAALICIFLMTDVEYLSAYSFVICVPFLVTFLFKSCLFFFFFWLCCFLLTEFWEFLNILDTCPLSDMWFEYIFYHL